MLKKLAVIIAITVLAGLLANLNGVDKINSSKPGAFQSGEKLTFEIKYGLVNAGQATLEVNEFLFRDSTPAYRITSLARTNSFFDRIFKVRDEIESILDKEKLVSHRFTKRLQEGTYRQYRVHFYYPEQGFTIYMKHNFRTKEATEERIEIEEDTQDILSAFYRARKQKLVVGESIFLNVTADGRNYRAEVKILRTERVRTIWGDKECLVLEPVLEGEAIFKQTGNILIWLTNDDFKIPVKLESKVIFGSFTANLIGAVNVPY